MINNKEYSKLLEIKNKITNEEDKKFLTELCEKIEKHRIKHNQTNAQMKRKKREENKSYGRSKKELEKYYK